MCSQDSKEPPSIRFQIPNRRLTRKEIVLLPAFIFVFGVGEYILITLLTDSIAAARRLAASISVFFYIILWYLVGREVLLGKIWLAVVYGLGCAFGTYITCRVGEQGSIMDRLLAKFWPK